MAWSPSLGDRASGASRRDESAERGEARREESGALEAHRTAACARRRRDTAAGDRRLGAMRGGRSELLACAWSGGSERSEHPGGCPVVVICGEDMTRGAAQSWTLDGRYRGTNPRWGHNRLRCACSAPVGRDTTSVCNVVGPRSAAGVRCVCDNMLCYVTTEHRVHVRRAAASPRTLYL